MTISEYYDEMLQGCLPQKDASLATGVGEQIRDAVAWRTRQRWRGAHSSSWGQWTEWSPTQTGNPPDSVSETTYQLQVQLLYAAPIPELATALGELALAREAIDTLLLFDYEPTCDHGVVGNDWCEGCGHIALINERDREEAEEKLYRIPRYAKARAALDAPAGKLAAEVMRAAARRLKAKSVGQYKVALEDEDIAVHAFLATYPSFGGGTDD